MPQIKIPAVYYRGGTSKGIFFKRTDLPAAAQEAGEARDKILLRVLGSPDPYGKQIDGLGNASSSTSKAVILDKSERTDHDVDYLFGQVSIDKPFVDWSGNCGNLTAAVGAFAIEQGLVDKSKIPSDSLCTVKIWQKNIGKTIIAHVPMQNGAVLETGDFELDGVTFPAAEVQIEFLDPADGEGSMFPTGNLVDEIDVPNIGRLKATLINAGIPTIFLNAADLGYTGKELQDDINNDAAALEKFETIRAYGLDQRCIRSRHSRAHAQSRFCRPRGRLHRFKRQNRQSCQHRLIGTRTEHGQIAPRHDGHRFSCHRYRRRRARYVGQPCSRRRSA